MLSVSLNKTFPSFQELFYCHGLRKLSISDNEIKTIPPAISSLISLEELDFSKNGTKRNISLYLSNIFCKNGKQMYFNSLFIKISSIKMVTNIFFFFFFPPDLFVLHRCLYKIVISKYHHTTERTKTKTKKQEEKTKPLKTSCKWNNLKCPNI